MCIWIVLIYSPNCQNFTIDFAQLKYELVTQKGTSSHITENLHVLLQIYCVDIEIGLKRT
jgi:hypothetical protein